MKRGRQGLAAVFAPLIAIAAASLFGLVVALTGDGVRDAAAWIALGVPVTIALWAMKARRS